MNKLNYIEFDPLEVLDMLSAKIEHQQWLIENQQEQIINLSDHIIKLSEAIITITTSLTKGNK